MERKKSVQNTIRVYNVFRWMLNRKKQSINRSYLASTN